MPKENSRVRINVQTGEFEIEGTEAFINEQERRLRTLVRSLREASMAVAATTPASRRRTRAAKQTAAAPKQAAAPKRAAKKAAAKPAGRAAKKAAAKPAARATKPAKKAAAPAGEGVKEFATLLKKLPEKVSDVDRLLVAGYYVQSASGDHHFTTRDANKLLEAAGAKIRNAAQAAKANIGAKRLVKVDRGRFRFTDEGLAYVKSLVAA